MSHLKKLWKFLSSMKFAILLLLMLMAACVLGSVIPQGNDPAWYLQRYSGRTGHLIVGTCLDDVFHCRWFLVLTVILCANLLLCNLLRLPQLLQRWRDSGDPEKVCRGKPTAEISCVKEPEAVFTRLRMPKPRRETGETGERLFSARNRIGLWGAWVCHLGILLLIAGVVLGQTTREEYTVYGVPGQTLPVGDTGCLLTIDDFDITWTDSGMPEQFTAKLTMESPAGEREQGTASVNNPARLLGYRIYQNSTGPAAKLTVRLGGETVQERILCSGDCLVIQGTAAAIFFDGYEAEAVFDDGGTYPAYDYSVYDVNRKVWSASGSQMEGVPAIVTENYEVRFSEAQNYTLLQIKRDNWNWLVLMGGLVTLAGLILAFYLQTRQVWAKREEDGTWTVCGRSRKGGALFAEQLRAAVKAEQTEE